MVEELALDFSGGQRKKMDEVGWRTRQAVRELLVT